MYYVYILQQIDKRLYAGRTDDLKRRFREHQQGKVRATKGRRPLVLIFYEAFSDKRDSIRRERYFKTTKGKSSLRMMLRNSMNFENN